MTDYDVSITSRLVKNN